MTTMTMTMLQHHPRLHLHRRPLRAHPWRCPREHV